MTRTGPWVLGAAVALLAAGVVSTSSNAWKEATEGHQLIELDMHGVDSLDMGSHDIGRVVIARKPARIHIKWFRWAKARDRENTVSAVRTSDLIRLASPERHVPAEIVVEVPPGLRAISGHSLKIYAVENAGTLLLEPWELEWEGDAEALDIRVQARVHRIDAKYCSNAPSISFNGGHVPRIRISIEAGSVNLGDLSGVEHVELHAGPAVGISVNRIGDLQLIEMHPFDREPTLPPQDSASGHVCMEYAYR